MCGVFIGTPCSLAHVIVVAAGLNEALFEAPLVDAIHEEGRFVVVLPPCLSYDRPHMPVRPLVPTTGSYLDV